MQTNPFQSGERKVIPAVLVYLRRGDRILMIHKTEKRGDAWHLGKWNGLGGKCELNESPLEAAQREVKEEAGVSLSAETFRPLGFLQFPNFKPHRCEDWIVFVFTVDFPVGEVVEACDEGEIHWIDKGQLLTLPLWEGDRDFLPWILEGRPFFGTFWYDNQKVVRKWLTEIAVKPLG